MKAVNSIFDGWTKQVRGWYTDYSGGRDIIGWLHDIERMLGGEVWEPVLLDLTKFTKFLALSKGVKEDIEFMSHHSLVKKWTLVDFPFNVLVYCNDVLGMTPDDFRTADLEYQFSLEDGNDQSVSSF